MGENTRPVAVLVLAIASLGLALAGTAVVAQDTATTPDVSTESSTIETSPGSTTTDTSPADVRISSDVSVSGEATVRPRLDPENADVGPGEEVSHTLELEHLDSQFDEERQVRGVEVLLEIDPDVAQFTEAGVDLFYEDRINDAFTEVAVSDDGGELDIAITYTEEDGTYMPDEPAEIFEVADITVDVQEVEPGVTTDLLFADTSILDESVQEYPSDPRDSTLAVVEPAEVRPQLSPEDAVGGPGEAVSYTFEIAHLDSQFDEERQIRGVEVLLGVDPDTAQFTEAGVDLFHGDRINDAFTEVTVSEDGGELGIAVTYTEGEDGTYLPEEPTEAFGVGELQLDVQPGADVGAETELEFLDTQVLDPDVDEYVSDPRSSVLTVGSPADIDLSFETATGLVPGEPQRYELTVSGAENGIASYDIELQIEDDTVAEFADVSQVDPVVTGSAIEDGGAVLNLSGQLDEPLDGDELVVADVWVETDSEAFPADTAPTVDSWDVTTVRADIFGDSSVAYGWGDVDIGSQAVGWFDPNGNGEPAQDVTGDGLVDDLTGDGGVTVSDSLLLFEHRETFNEGPFVPFFDFTGSDSVGVGDALTLFVERTDRDPD